MNKKIKIKGNKEFDISKIILLAIGVYAIITVILYLVWGGENSYETRHGKLEDYDMFTGIAIRNEKVVKCNKTGYPKFYISEGEKASAGSCVYEILSQKEESKGRTQELDEAKSNEILRSLENFQSEHNIKNYSASYKLIDNTKKILYKTEAIGSEDKGYKAKMDGVVSCSCDSLDGVTLDEITQDSFSMNDYVERDTNNGDKVSKGDVIYKLIRDEEWEIAVKLSEEKYKELKKKDITRANVEFPQVEVSTICDVALKEKNGLYLAVFYVSGYLEMMIGDRFVDIKAVYNSAEGLKIPSKSITKKSFYVIPSDFITGEDDGQDGVYVKESISSKGKYSGVEIGYIDNEKQIAYIAGENIKKGTIITNKYDDYEIGETKKLNGIYNINKGYPIFRRVNKLFDNGEFAIVEEGLDYSLANYDYIAADAKKAQEEEL